MSSDGDTGSEQSKYEQKEMKMKTHAYVGFREPESTGLLDRLCSRNTDVSNTARQRKGRNHCLVSSFSEHNVIVSGEW